VAASAVSAPAFAGATGNVGAFSNYMFRGISQSGSAAVQGGLDYATDVGLYVGTWGSNVGFGGGSEVDFYGGYSTKLGAIGIDVGAIYYLYAETADVTNFGVGAGGDGALDLDTLELYAGATLGPVAVKYFYSDETQFFGSHAPGEADAAGYLSASLSLPIKDSLNFTANLGYYAGDAVETFLASIGSNEDAYIDYGFGLSKTLDGGFTATFSYIGTDIQGTNGDDAPKYVVGLKKSFDL
jgi:uncharacterized protein (TIGR02001 family)